MAGAGYKVFNTGDVLLASEVNTYLMQQTVMVFDDATARSTAIPSPSEGMFSYLKDTNLTYRYDGSAWLSDAGTTSPLTTKGDIWVYGTSDTRLPVGTNGHTLVADDSVSLGLKWAAPAASGANWVLENSGGTALTGAATITITGISGKDKIMVLVKNASSASAGSLIGVRLNTDTGNNYYSTGATNDGLSAYSSLYLAREEGSTSVFRVGLMGSNAASIVNGYVLITGCNASGVKVMTSAGTGTAGGGNDHRAYYMGGYYDSSSLITSVSLFSFTGNFDAGTVFVYTSA